MALDDISRSRSDGESNHSFKQPPPEHSRDFDRREVLKSLIAVIALPDTMMALDQEKKEKEKANTALSVYLEASTRLFPERDRERRREIERIADDLLQHMEEATAPKTRQERRLDRFSYGTDDLGAYVSRLVTKLASTVQQKRTWFNQPNAPERDPELDLDLLAILVKNILDKHNIPNRAILVPDELCWQLLKTRTPTTRPATVKSTKGHPFTAPHRIAIQIPLIVKGIPPKQDWDRPSTVDMYGMRDVLQGRKQSSLKVKADRELVYEWQDFELERKQWSGADYEFHGVSSEELASIIKGQCALDALHHAILRGEPDLASIEKTLATLKEMEAEDSKFGSIAYARYVGDHHMLEKVLDHMDDQPMELGDAPSVERERQLQTALTWLDDARELSLRHGKFFHGQTWDDEGMRAELIAGRIPAEALRRPLAPKLQRSTVVSPPSLRKK